MTKKQHVHHANQKSKHHETASRHSHQPRFLGNGHADFRCRNGTWGVGDLMYDYIYDIESYPNLFSCVVRHVESRTRWIFEVSDRRSNAAAFVAFIRDLERHGCSMIGYNNLGYDYQVIHQCMMVGDKFTARDAYLKTHAIIHGDRDANFKATVWPKNHIVRQVDLYKINHFDNRARSTSLKVLEFNMRSPNIGDLPFPPGTVLTFEQMDLVIIYNCHDVDETEKFWEYSLDKIKFREELGVDVNWNDTKIGKKYFEDELNKAQPGITGSYGNMNQTHRVYIKLGDAVLPDIEFESESLTNVLHVIKNTTITETKSPPELKDLKAVLDDFTIDFGAGGGHGSRSRHHVKPDAGWSMIDVDVTSYYPSLAIANRFYPEHLSDKFCDIYQDLFDQRKSHPKKSAPNEMLKLALNGVYGDSSNIYSPFYDPLYTMKITINGQLLLALLAEKVALHTNGRLVQLNTDGITVLMPTKELEYFETTICGWWEKETGLNLERVEYSDMWIRDVNNYIARSVDGRMKRLGAYGYETARENPATREIMWHKDHSALVVPKAAEAYMVHGVPVEDFIKSHPDAFDFMLKAKVPGNSKLRLGDDKPLQKVTRYYIATDGLPMWKTMPPLPSKPSGSPDRQFAINAGYLVRICDDIQDFQPEYLNFDWYITEARKLVLT